MVSYLSILILNNFSSFSLSVLPTTSLYTYYICFLHYLVIISTRGLIFNSFQYLLSTHFPDYVHYSQTPCYTFIANYIQLNHTSYLLSPLYFLFFLFIRLTFESVIIRFIYSSVELFYKQSKHNS